MDELLKPEFVLGMDEESKRLILSTVTLQEFLAYATPETKRYFFKQEDKKGKLAVCAMLEKILQ